MRSLYYEYPYNNNNKYLKYNNENEIRKYNNKIV